MNIIFLDIDNVLNYGWKTDNRSDYETYGFADEMLSNLKYILDNAKKPTRIVISSSWRMARIMSHISKTRNWRSILEQKLGCFDNGSLIIDDIPHWNEYPDEMSSTNKRGDDIRTWLELYSKMYAVEKFVILDDICSCGNIPELFPDNFVNCDKFKVGECLSKRNADIALGILNS